MSRTRVVCTIGPATASDDAILGLAEAGMDVARLNFSHGTHEQHAAAAAAVRRAEEAVGRPIAVLQDLAGPKVRTGLVPGDGTLLVSGQPFVLTTRRVEGGSDAVSVTYDGLPGDVEEGDTLMLADGAIELAVESISRDDIVCRVVTGGVLTSHKGVNLPSRSITVPTLTPKDLDDLAFGVSMGADVVAVSFVRSAEDIAAVRDAQRRCGSEAPLVAKIEKHEAVENLQSIIAAVDGVMVARGDLGVEIPLERVPLVQKRIIASTNAAAKPVITATQMLKSMERSPRPTRAEVTDVANAVLDGTDAVMLSEETAIGAYPAESVRTLKRIAETTEDSELMAGRPRTRAGGDATADESVAQAACRMAEELGATAIVTFTYSGSTARLVAKQRPRQTVLAPTPRRETMRELAFVWGVTPIEATEAGGATAEAIEQEALAVARAHAGLREGEQIVVTAGLPLYVPGTTNLIKVATG